MPGTKAGGKKIQATMIKKLGSEEAVREWRRAMGAKGGAASNTGGFAAGEEGRARASKYGRIGGRKSKPNTKGRS